MTIQNDIAAGIESTVDAWRDQLLSVAPTFAHAKPSPDRWSISEVVGHLVDSACNNHQRFVRAQACDELVFPRYEQNAWTDAADYRNSDWTTLVQLWYFYNRQLAVLIRNIPTERLTTRCTITPLDACTLEFLVVDYLDHLKHHLGKLQERLAADEA